VRGQLHAFAVLPQAKKTGIQYIGSWVGLKAGSGRCEGEKNILSVQGIELQFHGPPTIQPIAFLRRFS
jgi:hypothetical protein